MLPPEAVKYLLLAFEGPDPYSRAGGLATRLIGLGSALAQAGYETHHVFIGDPARPAHERAGGVFLHRWGQTLARRYPGGVYDGEEEKAADLALHWPEVALRAFLVPAAQNGRRVVVLAEDWQVVEAAFALSDLAWEQGLRRTLTLVWNANNLFGFDRIDWARLAFVANLTTVSRWMKHEMWSRGVNPVVIPNGLGHDAYAPVDDAAVRAVQSAVADHRLWVKVGRFDPDKRWEQAIRAVARAKETGLAVRCVVRGGHGPQAQSVRAWADALGLSWQAVRYGPDWPAPLAAPADVVEVVNFLPDAALRTLYRAADAVLANSGREPFGLVGLEVMAAGGIAFVGATGEDYARPYGNAVVVETDDPDEILHHARTLADRPDLAESLREEGRRTALAYAWSRILPLFDRWMAYFLEGPR